MFNSDNQHWLHSVGKVTKIKKVRKGKEMTDEEIETEEEKIEVEA